MAICVIHTAAASYPWDNVYFCDINFRELMASKPQRSWGKTYTQGWNVAFKNNNVTYATSNASSNPQTTSRARTSRDKKDDCCWKANKNKCIRTGAECNYDYRCTYCAGQNHGFHNCRKRQNKHRTYSEKGGTTSSGSPKADKNSLQYDNTIVKNVRFVCILIQPQVLQYENFDLDTTETPVNIELFKQLLIESKYD